MSAKQFPLTCSGHTRPITDLCFSDITPDGYFVISGCKDGKPMIRNGQTGDWIGTFEGHKGAVWSARLDSQATKACTGSADFTAKVWDATTGDEVLSFSHKHIVRHVDFFKGEGQKLMTACQDKKIRLFDLTKPEAEPSVLEGHNTLIKSTLLGVGNDENMLLSAGDGEKSSAGKNIVRVWDLRTNTEVKRLELEYGIVSDMELSQDKQVLTMSHGTSVSFWDANTLEMTKMVDCGTAVSSATLHPVDKKKFTTGGQDFYLHVFDFESGREMEMYRGHHGPVHKVRYCPDGELYASGSEDGTVRLWQTEVGKEYGLWKYIANADADVAAASVEGEEAANLNVKVQS
eukprot:Nk52_evm9s206 gene=Nk52_evmTU9s206